VQSIYRRLERRADAIRSRTGRFVRTKIGGLHVDLDHSTKNTILIAGNGRGGTTWLAELVNFDQRYRLIFEPFHSGKVSICGCFARRQYLRPENDDPRYLEPANLILTGRVRSDWTDAYNKRFLCDRRLIKDIRVNLMLKWMRTHFSEVPIVLLLRHPCAVAHSRTYQGWSDSFDDVLAQELLVQDFLAPFVSQMELASSPFERHIFLWCIENYVPLRQLQAGDGLVVFYEDLCQQPERELQRLFSFLGRDLSNDVFQRLDIPSSQTRSRSSAIAIGGDLVSSWRPFVTPEMWRRAEEILQMFGLHVLYGSGSLPLLPADQVLVSRSPVAAGN